MVFIQWFLKKNFKLVISAILGLGLIVTPLAQAAYIPRNQKPAPKSRRSDAGTTRGCTGGMLPLTVLASRNYVGKTTSQQPTFIWFVPSDSGSKSMQFALYEQVLNGRPKAIQKLSLQSVPGIMKVMPQLTLQPGKDYFWQVVIQCDPDNPSGDLVSEGNIEMVTLPSVVQIQLNRAKTPAERANLYAEAGIWYDAFSEALKPTEASKLGALGSTLLNDLAQSEALESNAKQTTTLKQIATSSR
jgi:hypothetical protein